MRRRGSQVNEVRFHNPRLSRVGVEVLQLSQVRRRLGPAQAAERPDFHLLLIIRSGAGTHIVDFQDYALKAGDILIVRPGQVQQWRLEGGNLQGELVLVSAEALAPFIARAQADISLLALDEWPARIRPSPTGFSEAVAGVGRLRSEVQRFDGGALGAAVIWHELLALLLRLARELDASQAKTAPSGGEVHRLFMRELEQTLDRRTNVSDLARKLGYSESTLTRACLAATGKTAKEVLDLRVALEAKRLLVHTDASISFISHRLGFSEPTNFVKFFRRVTGTSPLAFRAAHAAT